MTAAGRDHEQPRAHAVIDAASTNPVGGALTNLSPDQIKTLLHMINTESSVFGERMTGEFSSLGWIIDTSASYHVIGDAHCLVDTRGLDHWPVGLPDGKSVMATLMVRVAPSQYLVLEKRSLCFETSMQLNLCHSIN